jgi:hypothetical protein
MPALAPYIPAREANFDTWLSNFSALITGDPAMYGLTAGDAANIASYVAAWSAAYAAVTSPSTKTAAAVAAKNSARVTVTAQVRVYAQQISLNPGVGSDAKVALGLNPRTSTPSPITPPASNPVLTLQSCGNLSAIVRYRDSAASVSVKAKPYGVIQCQLFGAVSGTPLSDAAALPLKLLATKSPAVLTFSTADVGKQFYCAARWGVRSGGVSPWSPMINFTVVGAL